MRTTIGLAATRRWNLPNDDDEKVHMWGHAELARVFTKLADQTGGDYAVATGLAPDLEARTAINMFSANVPVVAVLPYPEEAEGRAWTDEDRDRFGATLPDCERVMVAHPERPRRPLQAYRDRNELLVNVSDLLVVCAWGIEGGTAEVMRMARLARKPFVLIDLQLRKTGLHQPEVPVAVAAPELKVVGE